MAGIRDRTEDLKDTVRSVALSLGYDESKIAAVLASFIMRKPRQKSPFTKAALKTLESIEALEKFIVKHRKDYVDLHRTTEQERDNIEHEVGIFIKVCKEQIDILQTRIRDEDKNGNSKAWLGIRGDNSHADIIAHKHGVVLILSERLHGVTAQFDQLRAIRFQEAVNRATSRRKVQKVLVSRLSDEPKSTHSQLRERDEFPSEPLGVQHQLLDDETHALQVVLMGLVLYIFLYFLSLDNMGLYETGICCLGIYQVELSSLLDAVQETETKMVEMSALNHLMSTHVLQQAQQIELLYEQIRTYKLFINTRPLPFFSFCFTPKLNELGFHNVIFRQLKLPRT